MGKRSIGINQYMNSSGVFFFRSDKDNMYREVGAPEEQILARVM